MSLDTGPSLGHNALCREQYKRAVIRDDQEEIRTRMVFLPKEYAGVISNSKGRRLDTAPAPRTWYCHAQSSVR
jgi:hypothetical protein